MNLHNYNSYLSAICKTPLSEDKVIEYFKLFGNGHLEYKELLIEHNMRLVISIVTGKFKNATGEDTSIDVDDLISIGTVGLIKAINTFDLSKKIRFSTYATRCIENEIYMALRKVKRLKAIVSFDTVLNIDKNGNALTIKDTLITDQDIENECIRKITKEKIMESLYLLKELEQKIIRLRYGLNSVNDTGMSQRDIAKLLGYSNSYVSIVELRAIKKIACLLNSDNSTTNNGLQNEKIKIENHDNKLNGKGKTL